MIGRTPAGRLGGGIYGHLWREKKKHLLTQFYITALASARPEWHGAGSACETVPEAMDTDTRDTVGLPSAAASSASATNPTDRIGNSTGRCATFGWAGFRTAPQPVWPAFQALVEATKPASDPERDSRSGAMSSPPVENSLPGQL